MRIFLIRHGETDWNRERKVMGIGDVPLNENGRRMVSFLAEVLAHEGIGVIYSSTVARAMQSAEILAERWGVEIVEEPGFNECRFENWVGMSFDELRGSEDFEKYFLKPTESNFSTSENISDIQRRAVVGIERIISEKRAENVAVVTHSDIIKPLLVHFLGMKLDDMHKFFIANASVTLIDMSGRFLRIPYINSAPWKWQQVRVDTGS